MKIVSPRERAFSILHQVETEGAYSDKLLGILHRDTTLSARECSLVTQLVKGVLERRNKLDATLNRFIAKGLSSLPTRIQTVLRLGAYQLLELNNVSRSRAVSDSVSLARKCGHEGTARLVNAVLRRVSEIEQEGREDQAAQPPLGTSAGKTDATQPQPAEPKQSVPAPSEVQDSVPSWIRDRITLQWGSDKCRRLLTAFDSPLPLALRANTLRITVSELTDLLATDGWKTRPSRLYPSSLVLLSRTNDKKLHELRAFEQGLIYVQDEASAAVVPVLEPQQGELIVDLCAAPGGKTTQIAELTNNAATVLAVDPSSRKLHALMSNCARLGISSVTTVAADGATLVLSRPADRILVDAPCSGLGALGKKKDIRWHRREDQFSELIALQEALLSRAIDLVRPGGTIVYSTCSIDRADNEEVVTAVLNRTEGLAHLSPIPPPAAVGELGMDGASMRIWPDQHGSTGAFVCRIKKRSTDETAR